MNNAVQIRFAVIAPMQSVSTARKLPAAKAVWAKVFILFLLLGFWRTGGAQSTFPPAGAPANPGPSPVIITTTTPISDPALITDGQIFFNNLNQGTALTNFLGWNGQVLDQEGSLPSRATSIGQTLYWEPSFGHGNWQPTDFLFVDPTNDFVGVGNITAPVLPLGGLNYSGTLGTLPLPPPAWVTGPFPAPTTIPFSVDGDVTISGNYYGTNIYITSDERIKENVSRLSDWKRIFDIQPYSYRYVGQEHEGLSYGFLAQDVNRVLPELTSLWGNVGTVNYIGFIPFLTQGLQDHEERLNAVEQQKNEPNPEIEELKVEIGELKVENGELKMENQEMKERLDALEQRFNAICNLPCIQNNPAPNGNGGGTGSGFGQTGTLSEPPVLQQNEPNPASKTTVIRYFVPENVKEARIEVKNTEGKTVGNFAVQSNGHGSITIHAGSLAAGTYYYSLIIEGKTVETKKMILLN